MRATRRRSADETREVLLDAGVGMMLQRGASAGVQHIRLQEVLRRVGLTTGAAYRLWADQTEYQRDLAVRMVRLRLNQPDAVAAAAIDDLIAADAPFDEVLRVAALSHVASLERLGRRDSADSRLFLIDLALRATADSCPELQAASQERHAESIERFTAFYRGLMLRYGRRMREPYSLGQFAEAMAALGEGFALRASEGLPHPRLSGVRGSDREWTLFAVATRALVEEFTTDAVGTTGASSR